MNKIRIYELAKELNLSNKDLLDKLGSMNIEAHTHMGALEDKDVDRIRETLKKPKGEESKDHKTIVNVPIKQSVRHVSHGIHTPNMKEKPHGSDEQVKELKVTVLEEAKRPAKATTPKPKTVAKSAPVEQEPVHHGARIPAAQAAALKQEEKNNMAQAQHKEHDSTSHVKPAEQSIKQPVAPIAEPIAKEHKVVEATAVSGETKAAPVPQHAPAAHKKEHAQPHGTAAEKPKSETEGKPVAAPEKPVQPAAAQPAPAVAEGTVAPTTPVAPKPDYRSNTQGQNPNKPYQQRDGQNQRPYTPREGQTGTQRPYTPREGQTGTQRPYTPREGQTGAPRPYTPREGQTGSPRPYTPRDGQTGAPRPYTPRDGQTGAPRPYTPRDGQSQGSYNRPAPVRNADGTYQRPPYRPGGPSSRPPGSAPYGDRKPGFPGAGDKDKGFNPANRGKKPVGAAKAEGDVVPYADRASISGQNKHVKTVHEKKKEEEKKPFDKRKATQVGHSMQRVETGRSKTYKRAKNKQNMNKDVDVQVEVAAAINNIKVTGSMTVGAFATILEKPATDIILKLMNLGIMATINKDLDIPTLEILAADYDFVIESVEAEKDEDLEILDFDDSPEDLVKRPPVVTVMGHVDHGKTSLLDAIRKTKITSGEAGGITQHIGASEVHIKGEKIVFLDTPGHEAFTTLRARGAKVTDIAILVVAADDGVMPQTMEAIDHARAAKVPIIIAINKIDKVGANPDRVKQELADYGLLVEDWGGDIVSCEVSALKGMGIDTLLEMVLLVAEIQDFKANPNRAANGTIIDAKVEKGRGTVGTVIVQNGTLKIGDYIVVGPTFGKIKAMYDEVGKTTKPVSPSSAVEITGLNEIPNAGDKFYVVANERTARSIAEKRAIKLREESINPTTGHVTLEDLFSQIQKGNIKELNIIVKADVQGSVEALKSSLLKLTNEEVRVNVIHASVGTISESDILLASASNAVIIGFNVRPISVVSQMADKEKVDIKTYRIIYEAMNDVEAAMKGMLDPIFKEVVIGKVEVRATFKVPNIGLIAGAYVLEGKVTRNAGLRLVREGIIIHEGKVSSLRRFKDDAKEVLTNFECGIGIENYSDLREGDIIEAYINEEVKR
jgi:translation initiation factor IF-2